MPRLLHTTIRKILACRGYALSRSEPGASATLDDYLRALPSRGLRINRVVVADSDPEPVKIILGRFRIEQTSFHSGPHITLGELPGDAFLLECEHEFFQLTDAGISTFIRAAAVVVIRAQFGQFHRCEADTIRIATAMTEHGLTLRDVIYGAASNPVTAATGNAYFVFERHRLDPTAAESRSRQYRVGQAMSHLTAPVIGRRTLARLTGRGTSGFPAGISNPGAIEHSGRIMLLARGETVPWPVQKHDALAFVQSGRPMLLTLGRDRRVANVDPVTFSTTADRQRTRFEDFRLFSHDGCVYSNHSVIDLAPRIEQTVRPDRLHTSVGLSRLDLQNRSLTPLGSIALGQPLALVEKNWAMMSAGGCVHLIYSFNPYRRYACQNLPALKFTPADERMLALPIPDDGLPLRNSINPVPYDASHLLHIVHKVYPGKQYVHWAVLIDVATMLPTRMTARPLLRAGASAAAAILYVTAAVVQSDHIEIFAGLDDCGIGSWLLARSELDAEWLPINCSFPFFAN